MIERCELCKDVEELCKGTHVTFVKCSCGAEILLEDSDE